MKEYKATKSDKVYVSINLGKMKYHKNFQKIEISILN